MGQLRGAGERGGVVHVADNVSSNLPLLQVLAAVRSSAVREVWWMDAPPRGSAARSFLALMEHAVRSGLSLVACIPLPAFRLKPSRGT